MAEEGDGERGVEVEEGVVRGEAHGWDAPQVLCSPPTPQTPSLAAQHTSRA